MRPDVFLFFVVFTAVLLPQEALANRVAGVGAWQNLISTIWWLGGSLYLVTGIMKFYRLFKKRPASCYSAATFFVSGVMLLSFPFMQGAQCGPSCHSDFYYFFHRNVFPLHFLLVPIVASLPWMVAIIEFVRRKR